MNLRNSYSAYVTSENVAGSNKASSYIRALELLDQILEKTNLFDEQAFWSINSIETVGRLYEYALEYQKQDGSVFLQQNLPTSYGRNGYYSAALKSYQQFLVIHQYEEQLWSVYRESDSAEIDLSSRLANQEVSSAELLLDLKEFEEQGREGGEVLREVKARLGQSFFRKMILEQYSSQCCVTGLNIPEVLRASHIVGWAEDEKNRLNPANGLCLSATYDAAFDRHLISFDEDYRMILSPSLREFYSNEAFKTQFLKYEGAKIKLPVRYSPDHVLLSRHRDNLYY